MSAATQRLKKIQKNPGPVGARSARGASIEMPLGTPTGVSCNVGVFLDDNSHIYSSSCCMQAGVQCVVVTRSPDGLRPDRFPATLHETGRG